MEYTAYAPLMAALAQRGILCVLLHMPLNLAVLSGNAASGVAESYPDIDYWILAGHSLGGVMAASYAAGHLQEADALVLLGAYSTADLSRSGLDVLSLYGSEDQVLQPDKYEASRKNLPTNTREIVISGGCHAYFGSYGPQKGDGTPTISPEQQITVTADAIRQILP